MSPIDDELRATLRGRAYELSPAPDPLPGIERRAGKIRRNRVAASVAGSALAVAAIALAVPTLTPTAGPDRVPAPFATTEPTAAPSPVPTASPSLSRYALDPADPWPYRGNPDVAVQGDLDAYTIEWAGRRGVLIDDVRLTPLFGQIYEPSATPELVYVATMLSSGESWWGVAQAAADGPVLLVDRPLAPGTIALSAALPGDEGARLLVTASPQAEQIEYAANDATEFDALAELAPGVATGPLEGDLATDQLRVLVRDAEIFRGPAPDPSSAEPGPSGGSAAPGASASPGASPRTSTAPSGRPSAAAAPDNLLGWPARGINDTALVERAAQGYATAKGVTRAQVSWEVLFTGNNDPGQRYTVLNAWVGGQRAQVFGWIETPGRAPEPQLRPVTEPDQVLAAILLTEIPGRTTDELVVVPQPRTGDVVYRESPGNEGRSVVVEGLDGIALVDRARGAQGDSLLVLDGNGDLDNPTFEGSVANLLCGEKSCS